jgi:hypothetical protein
MTKHVLDRPRAADASRAQKFIDASRREGVHPATKTLIRRSRTEGSSRTSAFLRIAREGEGKV